MPALPTAQALLPLHSTLFHFHRITQRFGLEGTKDLLVQHPAEGRDTFHQSKLLNFSHSFPPSPRLCLLGVHHAATVCPYPGSALSVFRFSTRSTRRRSPGWAPGRPHMAPRRRLPGEARAAWGRERPPSAFLFAFSPASPQGFRGGTCRARGTAAAEVATATGEAPRYPRPRPALAPQRAGQPPRPRTAAGAANQPDRHRAGCGAGDGTPAAGHPHCSTSQLQRPQLSAVEGEHWVGDQFKKENAINHEGVTVSSSEVRLSSLPVAPCFWGGQTLR